MAEDLRKDSSDPDKKPEIQVRPSSPRLENQQQSSSSDKMNNSQDNNQSTSTQPNNNNNDDSSNGKIKPSLSTIPREIKQEIVYWLKEIEDYEMFEDDDAEEVEEVEEGDELGSDKLKEDDQEKAAKDKRRKKKEKDKVEHTLSVNGLTKTNTAAVQSSSSSSTLSSLGSDNDSKKNTNDKRPIRPLFSLSLVDRTFYELCREVIWESLDLEGGNIKRLRGLIENVLPNNANYVRKIWWRVTKWELIEFEDDYEDLESEMIKEEWDEEIRSQLLLKVLDLTKDRLIGLDIDLHPINVSKENEWIFPESGEDQDRESGRETDNPPLRLSTNKFLEPISGLRNLSSIVLTAPNQERPFTESFVVKLISEMDQLKQFGCTNLESTYPKNLNPCKSPLGIHLSKLKFLELIELCNVECIDQSWSRLDWSSKSLVNSLILEDCPRLSIEALLKFVKIFKDSIEVLDLDNVPIIHDGFKESAILIKRLNQGLIRFELPKLTILSISNYVPKKEFIRCFEDCKSIRTIRLGNSSVLEQGEIEELINSKVWPNLRKIIISNDHRVLSTGQIESLEVFCYSKGIAFEIDSDDDSDDDDDFDDSDDFEEEDEFDEIQGEFLAEELDNDRGSFLGDYDENDDDDDDESPVDFYNRLMN